MIPKTPIDELGQFVLEEKLAGLLTPVVGVALALLGQGHIQPNPCDDGVAKGLHIGHGIGQ